MRKVDKTVKMGKGDKRKVIPFSYMRPETWEECQGAFDLARKAGTIGDKLSDVDVFNYGFELKLRAKIQGANGEEGQKVKTRQRTTAWVMTPGGGEEFRTDLITHLTSGDTKGLNEYLDDLYQAEQAAIDEWEPAKA